MSRESMRRSLPRLVIPLLIVSFAAGCDLLGPRNQPQVPETRPNPTRPIGRKEEKPMGRDQRPAGQKDRAPLRPAPTKSLPGVSAVDADQLRASSNRILKALQRNDWAAATKETNKLGALWTRFRPGKVGTMSATEMKDFSSRYARLQKNVRARNKNEAIKDGQELKKISARIKT